MRKLIAVAIIVLFVVVAGSIADVVTRHHVEQAIASHIEAAVPGAQAQVSISSFPFLGHLAVSGDVPEIRAHVTGVVAGPITFDTVDVVIDQVKVKRSRLIHGQVQLVSIERASVAATVSEASIDRQVGLPVTIGAGTVGLAGIQVPAALEVSGNKVTIGVPPLPSISITIPLTNLLPCIGAASLQPGQLTVNCTTGQLPPVLDNIAASF